MIFITPLLNYTVSTLLFLFRFRESETKRIENYNTKSSKNAAALLVLMMLMLGLCSCGGSKPRIATTKKQAETRGVTAASRPITNPAIKVAVEKEEEQILGLAKEKSYAKTNDFIDRIVENAMRYQGVKYRYGGTTSKGMDCSGLIGAAFMEAGKTMPRSSRLLALEAKGLDLDEVGKGDFLFFATGKNKRQVNHVALITRVTPGEIEFIHSTTSRGVILSTLNEVYWIDAFLRAGRID